MTEQNYYQLGGVLPYNHPAYVRRKADTDLEEFISSSEMFCCFILAPRQMGKSSLIVKACNNFEEKKVVSTIIDISSIQANSENEFYRSLFSSVLSNLQSKDKNIQLDNKIIDYYFDNKTAVSGVNVQSFIINEILSKTGKNIVICLDEIGDLVSHGWQNNFLKIIRTLSQAANLNPESDAQSLKRMKFVLVGAVSDSDLLTDNLSAFNNREFIELTGLDKRCKKLQNGLSNIREEHREKVLNKIIFWTQGQPFLTSYICYLVSQLPSNSEPIKSFPRKFDELIDFEVIDKKYTSYLSGHFQPLENTIIKADDLNEINETLETLKIYKDLIQGKEVLFISEESSPYRKIHMNLIISGLVTKNNNLLAVANPIYECIYTLDWVEKQQKILYKKKELIMNNNQQYLLERDYTLIIDQSASMKKRDQIGRRSRWDAIKEVTEALALDCSEYDSDGVTVYTFASDFTRYDNVTESRVEQIFEEQIPQYGGTNLSNVLKDALDNYFERKSKNESKKNGEVILVVTDGRPDDEQRVEKVIIEASKKIDRDEELGISFIQIGEDREAREFLKYIDNGLIDKGAKFDICHTSTFKEISTKSFEQIIYDALYS